MEEKELKRARDLMVDSQLVPRGINDSRVLDAMRRIPRHLFVPKIFRYRAYDDCALPSDHGQTISQPYMVALMTQLLELTGREKVLEIGTGTGYQSAILSTLAGEVYTIETVSGLYEEATERLESMGYTNIHTTLGDGSLGLPQSAPYDRILVTAGAPVVPEPLTGQMADDGVLVIPVGTEETQELLSLRKKDGDIVTTHHILCAFVPLIGEKAWRPDRFRR